MILHKIWLFMTPAFLIGIGICLVKGWRPGFFAFLIPFIFITIFYGATYAMNPEKLTDNFKQKFSAIEAIKAWKEGKMIHRSGDEFPYFYTSIEVIINGKTERYYGRLEKDKTLSNTSFIKFDDLLNDDWIIEDSPKDIRIKIIK